MDRALIRIGIHRALRDGPSRSEGLDGMGRIAPWMQDWPPALLLRLLRIDECMTAK